MNILALDVSMASTGFSLIINGRIIEVGRIVTEKKEPSIKSKKHLNHIYYLASKQEDDRIYFINKIIRELIRQYNITDVVIEDQFIGKNARTGLTLSKLKGAVIFVAKDSETNIHHLKPTEVRKALMNIGNATKEKVAKYIKDNYIDVGEFSDKYNKHKTDDMYDSLACGIAFLRLHNIPLERVHNDNNN